MYFRDFNQHSTYFSQGIIKARQAELYNLLMFRFNNLENGETINISLTDDELFLNFLSVEFKRNYLIKETSDIYSVRL